MGGPRGSHHGRPCPTSGATKLSDRELSESAESSFGGRLEVLPPD